MRVPCSRRSAVVPVVLLVAALVAVGHTTPAGAALVGVSGTAPDLEVEVTTNGDEAFDIGCDGGVLSVDGVQYPTVACAGVGALTVTGDGGETDVTVYLGELTGLDTLSLDLGSAGAGEGATIHGPFPAGLAAATSSVASGTTLRLAVYGTAGPDTITLAGDAVTFGGSITVSAPAAEIDVFGGDGDDEIDASGEGGVFDLALFGGIGSDELTGGP